jgi:hypothetical protein
MNYNLIIFVCFPPLVSSIPNSLFPDFNSLVGYIVAGTGQDGDAYIYVGVSGNVKA